MKQPEYKINVKKLKRCVIKAQKGDKKALDFIVNETGSFVYYYCLKMLCDSERACEAVQDIFVTVIEKINTVKSPDAFLGWLKAVTANYCRNAATRERKDDELDINFEDGDVQTVPERCVETDEICEIIREAVNSLPEIQRECVLMYYYQRLSVREISRVLEVKEGTVKSRLFTARAAIKRELEKYGRDNLTLDGIAPLSMISYALISQAEETAGLKSSVLNIGTSKIAFTGKAAAKTAMGVKIAAVTVAATAAVTGAGTYVYKNFQSSDETVKTQNLQTQSVAPSETENIYDPWEAYYNCEFTEEDLRKEIEFNPNENLNSANNKSYIIDRICNSVDFFDTVQGTYYYYDNTNGAILNYYLTYCGDTNALRSKELTYTSSGEKSTYHLLNNKTLVSANLSGKGLLEHRAYDKNVADKITQDRVKVNLSNLQGDAYPRYSSTVGEVEDFVAFIDSTKRFHYEESAGENVGYFRQDILHTELAYQHYMPEVYARHIDMTNTDNWTVNGTAKLLGRDCFVISGTTESGITHSYSVTVDRETGAFLALEAYDTSGELITEIITSEFVVNGLIDESVFN